MAHIKLGIITGSGLDFSNFLDTCYSKKYFSEVFPEYINRIEGHNYQILEGLSNSIPTIVCNGRIHLYEGYPFEKIKEFLLFFQEQSVSHLILINAVGGLRQEFSISSFLLIQKIVPIFYKKIKVPEMLVPSWVFKNYEPRGTYIWVSGPCYETKSELKLFLNMGGDVIGMSGAPELYWALKLGIKTAMFSCVTNYCFDNSILTHQRVVENARSGCSQFIPLLRTMISSNLPDED